MPEITRREALLAGLGFAVVAVVPALGAVPLSPPIPSRLVGPARKFRCEFAYPVVVSERDLDLARGKPACVALVEFKYDKARERLIREVREDAGWCGSFETLEQLDMIRSPVQTAYQGFVRATIAHEQPAQCGCGDWHWDFEEDASSKRPPPGAHLWWFEHGKLPSTKRMAEFFEEEDGDGSGV